MARLASLDAFRGATMLFMASEIWRLPALMKQFPESALAQFVSFHTSHAAWNGGSLWDMIQPSFTFMVGVALPWSVANRQSRGQSFRDLWHHAVVRALLLVFLGIFLRSVSRKMTYFTFEDVLSQIGLGYVALFWLAWKKPRVQAVAVAVILVGYWAAFALYPLPEPGFDYTSVGIAAEGPERMTGFAAHWNKNTNLAAAFDQWFLNLLPREKPFVFHPGGYHTLSFIPSLATMLLGLLAGGVLRSERADKLRVLLVAGATGVAAGWLLGVMGICPVVKRIWTPSWTLFSGGWACLFLAGFSWWVDRKGHRLPRIEAVGLNSIAMYVIVHLWDRFLADSFKVHFGWNVLGWLPGALAQFLPWFLAWLVLWWCCLWMNRRQIYVRL